MAVARLSHEWLSCTVGSRVLYAMVLRSFPNRGLHILLLYSCTCAGSLVVWDRASVTHASYYSRIICQSVPHQIDFHGGEITRTSWQDGWSTADRVFAFYAVSGVIRKRERGEGGKSSESQVIFVIILAGYAWPSAQASDTLRSTKSDAANKTCHATFVCDYVLTLLCVLCRPMLWSGASHCFCHLVSGAVHAGQWCSQSRNFADEPILPSQLFWSHQCNSIRSWLRESNFA